MDLLPTHTDASGPYEGVVTVRLEQPGKPVVVLDHALIQRLEATLDAVPSGVRALVLASGSERVFVAGADLKTIAEWSDEQLLRYLEYAARVFGRLARFPFTTVAAINGAALGGGLEIAMHCDGMVAAPPPARDGQPGKPYAVGLPEAGLAICPGWGGTNLLPARINPADAIRRTATGQPMTFEEAAQAGLFDAIAPSAESLLDTAKEWAVTFGARTRAERDGAPRKWIGRPDRAAAVIRALEAVKPDLPQTQAAAAVADAVNIGLTRGWEAALEAERRHLTRLRNTTDGKEAIAAFFAKTAKK